MHCIYSLNHQGPRATFPGSAYLTLAPAFFGRYAPIIRRRAGACAMYIPSTTRDQGPPFPAPLLTLVSAFFGGSAPIIRRRARLCPPTPSRRNSIDRQGKMQLFPGTAYRTPAPPFAVPIIDVTSTMRYPLDALLLCGGPGRMISQARVYYIPHYHSWVTSSTCRWHLRLSLEVHRGLCIFI